MKPLKGKVFVVAETPDGLHKAHGGILDIPDMGTIETAAPLTGIIYKSACEDIQEGDRVFFEKGVGLKIESRDFCEHDILYVMRGTDVKAIFG